MGKRSGRTCVWSVYFLLGAPRFLVIGLVSITSKRVPTFLVSRQELSSDQIVSSVTIHKDASRHLVTATCQSAACSGAGRFFHSSGAAPRLSQPGKEMSSQSAGSCLCGNVRYRVDGSFDRFYLCHCAHCRKDTGSSHAANLFAFTATLTWLSGEASITTFRLPGTRHARSFCAVCGSALPFADANMVTVPAGSLDTDIDIAPSGNLFIASRASWDHDLHAAPSHDAFPT